MFKRNLKDSVGESLSDAFSIQNGLK